MAKPMAAIWLMPSRPHAEERCEATRLEAWGRPHPSRRSLRSLLRMRADPIRGGRDPGFLASGSRLSQALRKDHLVSDCVEEAWHQSVFPSDIAVAAVERPLFCLTLAGCTRLDDNA